MITISSMRRHVVASVMVAALVGLTAAVAIGLTYPEPVPSGALGPDWQCTRLAFVLTSCTRVVRLKTAATESGTASSCRRASAWLNALGPLH